MARPPGRVSESAVRTSIACRRTARVRSSPIWATLKRRKEAADCETLNTLPGARTTFSSTASASERGGILALRQAAPEIEAAARHEPGRDAKRRRAARPPFVSAPASGAGAAPPCACGSCRPPERSRSVRSRPGSVRRSTWRPGDRPDLRSSPPARRCSRSGSRRTASWRSCRSG